MGDYTGRLQNSPSATVNEKGECVLRMGNDAHVLTKADLETARYGTPDVSQEGLSQEDKSALNSLPVDPQEACSQIDKMLQRPAQKGPHM